MAKRPTWTVLGLRSSNPKHFFSRWRFHSLLTLYCRCIFNMFFTTTALSKFRALLPFCGPDLGAPFLRNPHRTYSRMLSLVFSTVNFSFTYLRYVILVLRRAPFRRYRAHRSCALSIICHRKRSQSRASRVNLQVVPFAGCGHLQKTSVGTALQS